MSKEIYLQQLASIAALPVNHTQSPTLPVGIALQEAEDLVVWCADDKTLLINAGLNWTLVDDLPLRISATRYIQSEWMQVFHSRETIQQQWTDARRAAYALHNELLHHSYHAFRKHPDLIQKISRIKQRRTHANMIQNLIDLSALANAHPHLFNAVGIDLSLFGEGETLAHNLSTLLAEANANRMSANTLRKDRDRVYTHMKQSVDEIRHHGQYLFFRDESRKKGYVSRYRQMTNQTAKRKAMSRNQE